MTQSRTRESIPATEVRPDKAEVLVQLERILSTPLFQHSKRYPAFLRHVVEQTLRGASDELKERTLGIAVFKRLPEYDTSADPVVRNTASEVRKRLDDYYSDAAHAGEIRITLPAGAYVPEFRYATENRAAISEEIRLEPVVAKRPFRWGRWAVGMTALVAAVGLMAAFEFPRKSAIQLFWAPILQAPGPVLVVADTLLAVREPRADSSGSLPDVREIVDPKVFLAVSEESAKLASFLGAQGKSLDYELARNVSLAKLRARPFILRGAFNNQWTERAVAPFRFYFQLDRSPLVRRILDRQNPDSREWAAPMRDGISEDYALIVRAPEPETGQMMLVIAGLGEKGSAAALEFVTNPKYLDRFAEQAAAGWDRRNIELVIKTDVVNDEWGEPHIVGQHIW